MKHLLFITTANLTTNPRLLKEMYLAKELGFKISFVGFNLGNWSDKIDQKYYSDLKRVEFHYLSATRKPFLPWLGSSILEKLSRFIYRLWPGSIKICAYASNKRSWLLTLYLKRLNFSEIDFIISHNLGALYPAYRIAKKQNIPFAFDVEDYHPGEGFHFEEASTEPLRRLRLMKELLNESKYITFASPLIKSQLLQNASFEKGLVKIVVNNCFSEKEFFYPNPKTGTIDSTDEKLRLVWFSQNINYGRGLEPFIDALSKFEEYIHLTLIGHLNMEFNNEWIKTNTNFIHVKSPLNQKELNQSLSKYDIGLAIELPTADLNRQLCLTNKIWAYLQAGLYIVATNTKAQNEFISNFSLHGKIVEPNPGSIDQLFEKLISQKDCIRKEAEERYNAAKKYSWEHEKEKVVALWK